MKAFVLLLLISSVCFASNIDSTKNVNSKIIAKKDTLEIWMPGVIVSAYLSQISFSNWTQGGAGAITWAFKSNMSLNYAEKDWSIRNRLNFAYGRTRLGGVGYQTNDNELFLESVSILKLGWKTDPYLSNSVRTTVAAGYNYKITPAKVIANFFDPGYIIQSIGFAYGKTDFLQTRLGLASQEVFANKYRQYTDNPATHYRIEAFKFEIGMESVTINKFEIAQNILLMNSLRLFTRFEKLKYWDVRWENILSAKVNSYIHVDFDFLLVYQRDQSIERQIKEGLQLGFTYVVL